jgi:hypothetical protein
VAQRSLEAAQVGARYTSRMKSLNSRLCRADAAATALDRAEFASPPSANICRPSSSSVAKPIANQPRLPTGRGGLLLQQVVLLHGLVPLLSRWVREQQPRDAAALGHHQ